MQLFLENITDVTDVTDVYLFAVTITTILKKYIDAIIVQLEMFKGIILWLK